MYCRARGPVVAALLVGAVLIQGFSWIEPALAIDGADRALRFEDVDPFVRANSPRARIIEQRAEAIRAEATAATTWSNPILAYGHEQNDAFQEWELTLAKGFAAPFAQSDARAGRDARIRAAELQAENELRLLVGELEAGYVELQLGKTYLEHLDRLSGLISVAASIAKDRYAEGELSGVARDLFDLAEYSVAASRRRAGEQWQLELASWQSDMGLGPGPDAELLTAIGFEPVELLDPGAYVAMLPQHPGTRARETLARSLDRQAAAVSPSLVPALGLYAGYRNFDPSFDGFVVGVAVDLPLFDRNGARAGELEAQRAMVEHELDLSASHADGEIHALLQSIVDTMAALERFRARAARSDELGETLLFSYREGSLTLGDLLGAIQIEMAALESYYDELAAWYANLFRLEAMTGAAIVQPGSGE